jgi:hypothetical protein
MAPVSWQIRRLLALRNMRSDKKALRPERDEAWKKAAKDGLRTN